MIASSAFFKKVKKFLTFIKIRPSDGSRQRSADADFSAAEAIKNAKSNAVSPTPPWVVRSETQASKCRRYRIRCFAIFFPKTGHNASTKVFLSPEKRRARSNLKTATAEKRSESRRFFRPSSAFSEHPTTSDTLQVVACRIEAVQKSRPPPKPTRCFGGCFWIKEPSRTVDVLLLECAKRSGIRARCEPI